MKLEIAYTFSRISCVTTRVTNKFKRYLYPQCSNVFIQVRNICCTGSRRMGGGTIFKVGSTSAR